MSYDAWKTQNPWDDGFYPEPEEEDPDAEADEHEDFNED